MQWSRTRKGRRKAQLSIAWALFLIGLLLVGIFAPAYRASAVSMTWTNNADFGFNKTGKCGPSDLTNIVITGANYTDASCASAAEDATMTLEKGGILLSDVKSVATGIDFSVVLKNDGTVWAWGSNVFGQLGDNTSVNRQLPIQVKDSTGNGYLSGITSISVGNYHSLAIKNDGSLWAWGQNRVSGVVGGGQLGDGSSISKPIPVRVKDSAGTGFLNNVVSISAGTSRSVAVKSDGTVWAWGANTSGTTGNNTVGHRDQVVSLPVQVRDTAGTGYLTNIASVSTGMNLNSGDTGAHTLALGNDGAVWAWGLNASGQLGDGTATQRNLPIRVSDSSGVGYLTGVSNISAGGFYSTAIKSDGTVYSWGQNTNGQLGDNTTSDRSIPVQVKDASGAAFLTGISKIEAGLSSTIAVKGDGSAWAWGLNTNGQLGDNTTTQRNLPVQIKNQAGTGTLSGASGATTANGHSLVLSSDGTVWGWGYYLYGQNGYSEQVQEINRLLPAKLLAAYTANMLSDVKMAAAGSMHSMALKNDGTVWAWGSNAYGQLGDNTTTQRYAPVQVKNASGTGYLTDVIAISSTNYFALALKSDGTVWAWGQNANGQLGDNTITDRTLPVQVKDMAGLGYLTGVTSIAAGGYFSVATKSDNTVWAWGQNANGQLGDNTTIQRNLPIQVKDASGSGNLTNITSASAGTYHAMALKSDGSVWSWGNNAGGQLGDNTRTQRNLPIQVRDANGTDYLSGVTSISAGGVHSMVLKGDGSVWNWGPNWQGNLGDGTQTDRLLPVQVRNELNNGYLTDVVAIFAVGSGSQWPYGDYSIGLKSDGTVYSWGANGSGQFGNGTTGTGVSLPKQAKNQTNTGPLTGVKAISGGNYAISGNTGHGHTLLTMTDGSLSAIGYNASGQLGDNSVINRSLPVKTYSSIIFTEGHLPLGTASGYVVDLGPTKKTKWQSINWNTAAIPANTSVTFNARTSNNGTDWSAWSASHTQNTAGTATGAGDLTALPFSRYIELKVTLANTDYYSAPVLNDFSLSYLNDNTTPPTNASAIVMKKSSTGAQVAEGAWNNAVTPYFTWTDGVDENDGSGIGGYCLYLGQEQTSDVTTTKGILGNSLLDTDGKCQYAVPTNSLDLSVANALSAPLSSSTEPYYLLVKAIDKSGNLYADSPASLSFKYDNTAPKNVSFVSVPSQFVPTKDVTVTWPTSDAQAASDGDSGLAGLQYRIGANGTWQGENHTGAQDITDVLLNDGSYQTDPTHDYPLLNEGNNLIYFRSIDNAGNVATTQTSAVIKINTSSPSQPQNIAATPTANTSNDFAFSWQRPETFVGTESALTYCYTVNTLPTENTCTYTAPGQTSLSASAYATQPGENTFYVVAKDEAGNINYATHANVTFTANTSAPGIPLSVEIADISVKSTQSWKVALSWEQPTDAGAGVATYQVFRSTSSGTGFTRIASTSGNSYVDTGLSAVTYYYKVKACDSANHCGAMTTEVNMLPTGRFTSPAEIVTAPSVAASTKKATINWATERGSDSRIQYGTESGKYYSGEVAVSDQVKTHTVDLSGLDAGTTYYYKAKWTDEDGNMGTSSELSFTTLPAPVIKNVEVIRRTLSSATIQFTSQNASKVSLYYGKTEGFGGFKDINTSVFESTYTIELSGLDDGSTYFFRPDGTDTDGFSYTGTTFSFQTPPRPRISNLRFQPIDGEPTSTQKVTWTTNVPASSTVTYGLESGKPIDIFDSKMTTDHGITIQGLLDDSNYFLLAQSRDIDGNLAVGDRQVFKTALDTRPPKISDVNIETTIKGNGSDARGQIVVSWKTDEPTTSQVAYGEGNDENYSSRTTEDGRFTTDHVVIISDLSVSKVYYLQPIVKDKASNVTKDNRQSAIIGRPSESVLNIILNALNKVFGL